MKPRLLDLFCGAGGCSVGYARAGFEVVGVDIEPQPNYPFEFFQADAMDVAYGLQVDVLLGELGEKYEVDDFAAVHASPPCQAFTSLKGMHNAKQHADLLTPTRERLQASALPYVIENVEGAPMLNPVMLCGSGFGLEAEGARLQRHRLFETNFPLMSPGCAHGRATRVIGVYGGHGRDRRRKVNTQDFSTEARRVAMGIDWMTGAEPSQAIPPAYTEHIGSYLLDHLRATTGNPAKPLGVAPEPEVPDVP